MKNIDKCHGCSKKVDINEEMYITIGKCLFCKECVKDMFIYNDTNYNDIK